MQSSRNRASEYVWISVGLFLLLVGCATSPQAHKSSVPEGWAQTSTSNEAALGAPMSDEAVRRASAQAHFAMGIIYEQQQQAERALEEFYAAAKADITNEHLVLEAAQKHLQLKKLDQALELLKAASQNPNASGEIYAWLGLTYGQLNQVNQAIRASRTAIRKSPKLLLGYQSLAQIYLQRDRIPEALKVLDEAAQLSDTDAVYLVNLAEILSAYSNLLGKDSASVKPRILDLLSRAAQLKPSQPSVRIKLADGFKQLGEMEKAGEIYQELLKEDDSIPGLREKLADLYLRQGNRPAAQEQLEHMIRENPLNAQAYYLLGNLAGEEKNFSKAAEYFERALLFNPSIAISIELAAMQIASEQGQRALATLDKVRSQIPPSFAVEFYTGMARMQLKQYRKALDHLLEAEVIAKAKETNHLNHILYFQLGAAFERNQNYEQAALYFKKCIELSPKNVEAMNYLGYMWAEQGLHLEEAKGLIEKAVAAEQENAAYLDSLGWVLYKMGRFQEALPYLLKSLEFSKEPDPTLWDHLGDIYSALKQKEKAREAWSKSIQIEPNEEIAKKVKSATLSEESSP